MYYSDFEPQSARLRLSEQDKQEELGRVALAKELIVDVETLAEERFTHGKYLITEDGKSEYIVDENGQTILLFEGGGEGRFNSIYSPLTKQQLTRELLALPEEQHKQLRELLELPEPTQADLRDFQEIQKKRQKETELLDKILKLPSGLPEKRKFDEPNQNLIRGIIQKEYAITDADSENPVIGTSALGPCIALTVYDSETRTAAVAHIDGTTNIQSLSHVFAEFGRSNNLDIRLIGGDDSSRKLAIQLIVFIQNQGMVISHADILDKPHPSAFVIDARTGAIIPGVTTGNMGEDEHLRMQLAGLMMDAQIKKEFDGRKRS